MTKIVYPTLCLKRNKKKYSTYYFWCQENSVVIVCCTLFILYFYEVLYISKFNLYACIGRFQKRPHLPPPFVYFFPSLGFIVVYHFTSIYSRREKNKLVKEEKRAKKEAHRDRISRGVILNPVNIFMQL